MLRLHLSTQSLKLIAVVASCSLALNACSLFKKDEEESNLSASEMYLQAKEELDDKNWPTAVELLQQLEARHPYGKYAKQAQLDTIYAQYKRDLPELAIAAANRFISLYPTDASLDYAHYLKGLASFNERNDLIGLLTGRTDLSERDPQSIHNAIGAFQALLIQFPDSNYARDAKRRIQYLRTALASREIRIAQYYYSREAYLAAVNRAKFVLENFTDSAAVEDALGIMVHAYEKMDLAELSSDSRRVLQSNYPDSAYLKSVREGERDWLERLRQPFSDLLDG